MNSFIANFIAMFVPNRQRRHIIRRKIKHFGELVTPAELKQAVANAESQKAVQVEKAKKYRTVKKEWLHRNGSALIPGRFSEYDLIFAIGATCHITGLLDICKLRLFSSPLDWTGGIEPENWWQQPNRWRDSRFREKIDALCSEFENYFNPCDLCPTSQCFGHGDKNSQHVSNMRTRIRFIHLFNNEQSFEKQIPDAAAKLRRRSERLISAINQSDKILICWAHRIGDQRCMLDACVSDDDVLYAVAALQKKWPDKQFDLCFFEHDGTKEPFQFEKQAICDGAFRIRSDHFIIEHAYETVADYKSLPPVAAIAEALDNISLTDKLKTDFSENNLCP